MGSCDHYLGVHRAAIERMRMADNRCRSISKRLRYRSVRSASSSPAREGSISSMVLWGGSIFIFNFLVSVIYFP